MTSESDVRNGAKGKLILRFALDQAIRLLLTGALLFWLAGTLAWWPAWALLGINAVWMVGRAIVILRTDPALIAERLAPPRDAKRWDAILVSIHGLLQMMVYVMGGLDRRFGWSGIGLPLGVQLAGLAACILGYAAILWATACNPFFSLVVRIQRDRGHTVASSGPYRFVRHPAYAGGILLGFSLGLALGSWWAFLIGLLDAALMVLRTHLEDRDLLKELPGYPEYARRVRFRLVPGIW